MTERAASTKFRVDDTVRFIGTDTLYTVTNYCKNKLAYQVQCGDDAASSEWVPEIYLEQGA